MAIYHCSIKIFSRGKGASAVAKAAYRAGQLLHCEYDGTTHDYTRKGGVIHTEILLPTNASAEYADRAVLWNAVEQIEKAKNSQLAREIEIGLPAELTAIQNRVLIRDYVQHTFVDKGMCADICIHDKKDGNPHAHIMLTMRPFNEDGTWGAKAKKEYLLDANGERIQLSSGEYKSRKSPAVDWNEQTKAEEWRAAWADTANRYLEKLGHPARLDHRSYERQGIEQVPTVHLGVAAHWMEKRGIRTKRGDVNREVAVTNSEIRQLRARVSKLRDWLKEAEAITPPTFAELIESKLLKREGQGRYQQIADLKQAAATVNFITKHDIQDYVGFSTVIKGFYARQVALGGKVNQIERRIQTLDEHIKQTGIYKQYGGYKARYDKLCAEHKALTKASGLGAKRKAQKALDAANEYYKDHRTELTLHAAAVRYLQELQKGKDSLLHPSVWEDERKKLAAERQGLSQEYFTLKEEVKQVEIIRRTVEDIMREESRERLPIKALEIEL